jgi:hypothetical protein
MPCLYSWDLDRMGMRKAMLVMDSAMGSEIGRFERALG